MDPRWDIFCKVVDNFGDAGVAWRLARVLAREHSLPVRLWIDDPRSLARIAPGVDTARDAQCVDGIDIRVWRATWTAATPAGVVVEAFGCGLPDDYVAAMAETPVPPVWFVLEYLSAEPWIDGAHGLPSPHLRLALSRRFWFPGFTDESGGLLRERGLFQARDAFGRESGGRAAFWSSLSVPAHSSADCRVSLFCYPNPALPALLDAWADGDDPVSCVIPEGVAAGALDAWTAGNVPHVGRPYARGRVALHAIPFLSQDDYDRLLWACDVNFVRGEDSFVRAQWAARPFVWHIYPQAEDAHLRKLDAFVRRYAAAQDAESAAAVQRMFHAWNGAGGADEIGAAWEGFATRRFPLERHGNAWSAQLAALPELAAGLVKAASDRL
jgi:uncharacterized repeat protein (TIGR03837 family)